MVADACETEAAATPDLRPQPLRDRVFDPGLATEDRVAALEPFLSADDDDALALWFGDAASSDTSPGRLRRRLDADIARLDDVLARGVDAVLHHSRFQALESAWRGLAWLVAQLGVDAMSVVRVLDARWAELARDLERAPDFDQSTLFLRLYEDEFGTPGGTPFSMMVGLYDVAHRPGEGRATDDVAVLRQLSRVAAAAFCPVVLSAAPAFFGVDALGELDLRRSLASELRTPAYARLQSFQQTPDARFVALAAPRFLIRSLWEGRSAGDCGFRYAERPGRPLWGAAGLALAAVCIRSFQEHRWLGSVRGVVTDRMTGGVVPDSPHHDFATDRPGVAGKAPLEVELSDALERELTEAGVLCLRRCKHTPHAAFYNLPTAHRPRGAYVAEAAKANERLGAMLNYVLCVSRFSHHIKVIARDWIGSIRSAEECETRLQSWLNGFTASGDNLSYDTKARYPLQAASVIVRDLPGRPGAYTCTARLKPHFQLDQAVSEFQLVTLVGATEKRL